MKKLIFLLCAVFIFYSHENRELPCEKVYVVEYKWSMPEDGEDYKWMFRVARFSELSKDFNLHCAYQSAYDLYYTSDIFIVDSLKDKISDIINEYPTDTAFLYKGEPGSRIYDGNGYIFIFQKNDDEFIRIYFEPKFLPQDLLFIYNCLYENRKNEVRKNQYIELFTTFEKIIMSGKEIVPPPPILKETIQFTPPVIKKRKK